MTTSQNHVNKLLQHLAQRLRTPLELKNGVCALQDKDNGHEAIVIEVPEHSDSAILHCSLLSLSANVASTILRQLLLLNFEISAMQGCWLAVDENDKLCLCHVYSLDKADEQHFTNTVMGFISQVKEVRAFVAQMFENRAAG